MGFNLSAQERLHRMQLYRSANVGPVSFRLLITEFGSATQVIEQFDDILEQAGLHKGQRKRARTGRNLVLAPISQIEAEMSSIDAAGGKLLVLGDNDYPTLLSHIADAPGVVTMLGNEELLNKPALTIVGSREPSIHGRQLAHSFAKAAAEKGYVVVSGMARGVDATAHLGAECGNTIAVLAGGADNCYPPENNILYNDIRRQGAILAEQPMGTVPQARHFPRRNRIISGMALLTVVIEASAKSGTMITGRCAADQGREVAAVPGSPFDPRARGGNRLISEGAHLVESAEDVLGLLANLEASAAYSQEPLTLGGDPFQTPPTLAQPDKLRAANHFATKDQHLRGQGQRAGSISELLGTAKPSLPVAQAYSAPMLVETIDQIQHMLTPSPMAFYRLQKQCGRPPDLLRMAMSRLELAGLAEWTDSYHVALTKEISSNEA